MSLPPSESVQEVVGFAEETVIVILFPSPTLGVTEICPLRTPPEGGVQVVVKGTLESVTSRSVAPFPETIKRTLDTLPVVVALIVMGLLLNVAPSAGESIVAVEVEGVSPATTVIETAVDVVVAPPLSVAFAVRLWGPAGTLNQLSAYDGPVVASPSFFVPF